MSIRIKTNRSTTHDLSHEHFAVILHIMSDKIICLGHIGYKFLDIILNVAKRLKVFFINVMNIACLFWYFLLNFYVLIDDSFLMENSSFLIKSSKNSSKLNNSIGFWI
nr:MAG TPA: hypothetical protein [Caudoviricetes sp.]